MNHIGYLTDCIFHRANGSVLEREDYWVIRTPSNPNYYWGNFLLFKSAPPAYCMTDWKRKFHLEFGNTVSHMTFGWDTTEPGSVEQFVEIGFEVEKNTVMTMESDSTRESSRMNEELSVRRIESDQDWEQATDLQVEVALEKSTDPGMKPFTIRQMEDCRKIQEKRLGQWWGAFYKDEIVGDLGIFWNKKSSVARFHNVETKSTYRRQGVCSTLIPIVLRETFSVEGIKTAVIAAETERFTKALYQSLGFNNPVPQYGVCLPEASLS